MELLKKPTKQEWLRAIAEKDIAVDYWLQQQADDEFLCLDKRSGKVPKVMPNFQDDDSQSKIVGPSNLW